MALVDEHHVVEAEFDGKMIGGRDTSDPGPADDDSG
jgi:hypothetical protein